MRTGLRRGFTLIELLTVIAIIAVLAAILFPVFSRVQENARKATCISNMHNLVVAAKLYKDDNFEYPPMLLGYAERPDGLPWQPGDPGPVPAGQVKHSFLLPYLRQGGIATFHCPDNPDRDTGRTVTAVYPANAAWSGDVLFGQGGFIFKNLPPAYAGKPIYFYAYDSYDITALLDASGQRPAGGFELAYTKDWTGGSGPQDAPEQLKYRGAPDGDTVFTWCHYHVAVGGASQTPVMLLTGRERLFDYKKVVSESWRTAD